jgi:RNA polymerase sigma-70 factor (ECF subfamily)
MEKHLAGCPRCRSSCDGLKEVLRVCRTSPEPEIPAELQDRVRRAVHEAIGG